MPNSLIKKAYEFFGPIILPVLSIAIFIFRYRKFSAFPSVKKGFKDHRGCEQSRVMPKDMAIFKRLLDSYNKAKREQENIDQPYRVGHLWQNLLNVTFQEISDCLRDNDITKLQAILENFQREQCSYYIAGTYDAYHNMKRNPFYKFQFVNTWYEWYNIYKELVGDDPHLTYPVAGNPVGLYHEGQIIPFQAIEYHYNTREILSLLRDVNNPLVCEIGGGTGGQAYTVLSNSDRRITYILLDIPEVLLISSYFLMSAFPNKKFLLYGEGSLDSGNLDQWDVILMPNFMLPQLGDETVDLFFNACSFSEMNSATVEEYVRQVERICRNYFMHINHNINFVWYDDGKKIVNMIGSEIRPDPVRFKKIYQRPRLFATLEDKLGYYYYKAGHFAFLYEIINSPRGNDEIRQEGTSGKTDISNGE